MKEAQQRENEKASGRALWEGARPGSLRRSPIGPIGRIRPIGRMGRMSPMYLFSVSVLMPRKLGLSER
jgi:hypothetical protein